MRIDGKASQRLLIVLALVALYFIWGSTFLAMRIAIDSFPPFMMAALRFVIAGALLFAYLCWRGAVVPGWREWLGATAVGGLLLAAGNGAVAYAEQTVSTGVSALTIATVPLWMALFSACWGQSPNRREWSGIAVGTLGVVILTMGQSLQASPVGALVLILAAASWAFGSVWGKVLPMPTGAMASAAQMLGGGLILVLASMVTGESWPRQISQASVAAIIYLIILGSLVAYSAYLYLLKTVRPALATSYAFINPLVAMWLGVWLAGESIDATEYLALAVIVVGVLLVLPIKWPGIRLWHSWRGDKPRDT